MRGNAASGDNGDREGESGIQAPLGLRVVARGRVVVGGTEGEVTNSREQIEPMRQRFRCRQLGIFFKLVLIFAIVVNVVLWWIVPTARAQTEPRQSFDIDGITFRIPASVQWNSFVNTASGQQTLELFVPTGKIKAQFSDVQGRKKETFIVIIQSDLRNLGRLTSYDVILNGKNPTSFGKFSLYPVGGFDFYLSTDKSQPHFFWCEVKKVGVLEGQPRICFTIEDINDLKDFPNKAALTSVRYGFTFDDIPNLQKIKGDIIDLLSSMITIQN